MSIKSQTPPDVDEVVARSFDLFPDESSLLETSLEEYVQRMEAKEGKRMKKKQEEQRQADKPSESQRKASGSTEKGKDAIGKKAYLARIPIDSIVINDKNPRTDPRDGLESLMTSIKQFGLLQSITVAKRGDKYLLIDGHRRRLAMMELGAKEIDAKIIDIREEMLQICPLATDTTKIKLTPIEVAKKYKELIDEYGITQRQLGTVLGVKETTISDRLSLLSLPETIRQDYADYFKADADEKSPDFDSRRRREKRPDLWTMRELSKVSHQPYQERLYERIKRAYARKHPPKRDEVGKMIHGVKTDDFRMMPDVLKNIFFESDFLSWKHICLIHNPPEAGIEELTDDEFPEKEKASVARWAERLGKTAEQTKSHLRKLSSRKLAEKSQEQGGSGSNGRTDDVLVSNIVTETGAFERKLLNLCPLAHSLSRDNPNLLGQLQNSVKSLRLTAESLLSAIEKSRKKVSEADKNTDRKKQRPVVRRETHRKEVTAQPASKPQETAEEAKNEADQSGT